MYYVSAFEQFIFWGVLCITGLLLFTHVTNLTNVVEAKIPYLAKMVLLIIYFLNLPLS